VRINERSHAVYPLPNHSETYIQRARGEHTTGEHTPTHASRHTHLRPRGRKATWRLKLDQSFFKYVWSYSNLCVALRWDFSRRTEVIVDLFSFSLLDRPKC
jgi:hypothetical protein